MLLGPSRQCSLTGSLDGIAWASCPVLPVRRVEVSLADGSTLRCRHLVCTLPLGVLKAHHTSLFRPALPAAKVRALRGLAMGLLNKVVLAFPHRFWSEEDNKEWLLRVGAPAAGASAAAASTAGLGFTEFYNLATATGQPVIVAFSTGLHAWQLEQQR